MAARGQLSRDQSAVDSGGVKVFAGRSPASLFVWGRFESVSLAVGGLFGLPGAGPWRRRWGRISRSQGGGKFFGFNRGEGDFVDRRGRLPHQNGRSGRRLGISARA